MYRLTLNMVDKVTEKVISRVVGSLHSKAETNLVFKGRDTKKLITKTQAGKPKCKRQDGKHARYTRDRAGQIITALLNPLGRCKLQYVWVYPKRNEQFYKSLSSSKKLPNVANHVSLCILCFILSGCGVPWWVPAVLGHVCAARFLRHTCMLLILNGSLSSLHII